MGENENRPFRPRLYHTPKDKSDDKAYPNGILVTFAALWQRWAIVDKGRAGQSTSAKEFAETYQLRDIGFKLKKDYPGSPIPPGYLVKSDAKADAKAGAEFQYLGGSNMKGSDTKNLSYMALRRAADVVDLPAGLFVLFTNFVSLERRTEKRINDGELSSKRVELLKLAEKVERFGHEVRKVIEESSEDDEIFYDAYPPGTWVRPDKNKPDPEEEAYLADLKVLKRLRDACKIGNAR